MAYTPPTIESEHDEMRRKAMFSIRIERVWLRILKLENGSYNASTTKE